MDLYGYTRVLLCMALSWTGWEGIAQVYPSFGKEKPVVLTGYVGDAMEPFLSHDGNFLFFNSLNDGITTSLYYAVRTNDTTFAYQGPLAGTNQPTTPRLDAVPSMDSTGNFFWVSTRNYPVVMDNLHYGRFLSGTVSKIGRVHGDFYVYAPGWIIMDGAINPGGDVLFYNNALFNNCTVPCEAKLGMATKINDSTFNKTSSSDGMLQQVNQANYLVYAPHITGDGLELYYTRILKGSFTTEICVAVRNSALDNFSAPVTLYSDKALVPEAPTLSSDKQRMYYHKKSNGTYRIFMRYRNMVTAVNRRAEMDIHIFPNPADEFIYIRAPHLAHGFQLLVFDAQGNQIMDRKNIRTLDISTLPKGSYLLQIKDREFLYNKRFVKR